VALKTTEEIALSDVTQLLVDASNEAPDLADSAPAKRAASSSKDEDRRTPAFRFYTCDTCGERMDVGSGIVEWWDDGVSPLRDFRIVHKPAATSAKPKCTKYVGKMVGAHASLSSCSGADGPAFVLSRLSDTTLKAPMSFDEFTIMDTVFKRLSVPHFEAARHHFVAAESDGYFDGRDPDDAVRQAALREIINLYG
jgi:hypothetical protein